MEGAKKYIEAYTQKVEKSREKYIAEVGNDSNYDSLEYIDTAEEIAGYYLYTYGMGGIDAWLQNLYYAYYTHDTDEEVTRVLMEISLDNVIKGR